MVKEQLISVIVPVYNVEKYLNECVDSIVNQTYKNLEIILVDDGSTDSSPSICDEYAKKDSRVIVIHKKNEGVSAARNTALDVAKGQYISFLDSDDLMAKDAIKNLYKDIIEYDADISCGNTADFKDKKPYSFLTVWKKEKRILHDPDEILGTYFCETMCSCVIWARLYKREFIGNHRFNPKLNLAEDFDFLYKHLGDANTVVINNEIVTNYYRVRDNSLAHLGKEYDKKYESEIALNEEAIEFARNKFPNTEKNAIMRLQKCCLKNVIRYYNVNKEVKGVEYLFEKMNEYPMKLVGKSFIKYYAYRYFSRFLGLYFSVKTRCLGLFIKKQPKQ